MSSLQADLVSDAGLHVGEGPCWEDGPTAGLLWVDHEGQIRRYTPASGEDRQLLVRKEGQVASVRRRSAGGYVVALDTTFHGFDGERLDPDPLAVVERGEPRLLNDTAVDSRGRLWAGLYDPSFVPGTGELLRIEADGEVAVGVAGLVLPNGIGFSPSNDVLYLTDSFAFAVIAYPFDLDTGSLGEARVLWSDREGGYPDGLAVDTDGNLWIAFWEGWAVRCISPDGELLREIRLPVSQASSCAFGGADLADLYVTTARYELTPETLKEQPHAGGLFRIRTDVTGATTFAFAG